MAESRVGARHASGTGGTRRRIATGALAALVLLLAATGLAAWGTHTIVRDQERRLLNERAAEVGLVFTSAASSISSSFNAAVAVLRVTGATAPGLTKAAAAASTTGTPAALALVQVAPSGGMRVLQASGISLKVGQSITGPRAAAIRQALADSQRRPAATSVMGTGDQRSIGFAVAASGVPGAAGPLALYRETPLGRLSAGRQSGNAAFHELDVVLYADTSRRESQLIVSTAGGPIPTDGTRYLPQPAGSSTWLLGVRGRSSLVGSVASSAWWVVLLGGSAAAVLLAAMVQVVIRRRDVAISLYAAEHQQAETLQRSLLPSLPDLPGLDLAARYQAGGLGQQVGGDWFDVFALPGGSVGFAIGDVMGHDLKAAAAMSQVRAVLRAYAYGGAAPGEVLDRLDDFVQTFELTDLVSVFYGVLGPEAAGGARPLDFANAGHLAPFLQGPEGRVEELSGGASVVIGVPFAEQRTQARTSVEPGSTLLLFTDGLLEAPDRSLADTIPALARTVAEHVPDEGSSALCDRVLKARAEQGQRDDIALLALRVRPLAAPSSDGHAAADLRRGQSAGPVPEAPAPAPAASLTPSASSLNP